MNVYLSITISFLIFVLILSLIPLAFKIKALVSDTYRNVQTQIHRVSSFVLLGISAILLIVSAIFIRYQEQKEALKKNYRKNSPKRYKATSYYSSPYNITKWSYTFLGALFIGSSIFYGATIEKVLKDNKKEDTIFIYASLGLACLISLLLLIDFYIIYKPQPQNVYTPVKTEDFDVSKPDKITRPVTINDLYALRANYQSQLKNKSDYGGRNFITENEIRKVDNEIRMIKNPNEYDKLKFKNKIIDKETELKKGILAKRDTYNTEKELNDLKQEYSKNFNIYE